jgi:hypothetical protein
MESRRARRFAGAFGAAGAGLVLVLALLLGPARSGPAQLVATLGAAYLAVWGVAILGAGCCRKPTILRFIVCSTALAVCLAAFEAPALIGLVDYRSWFANPAPAWFRPENQPDRDLIYARRPGFHYRRMFQGDEVYHLRGACAWRTYRSDLQFDHRGFRNGTDVAQADTIVLGDSFIEGAHVSDREVMTAQLAGRLGQTVVNLGRTGYGPQQERFVLERHGPELKPRTCVWAFYEGNDIDDAERYEADRAAVAQALARTTFCDRVRRTLAWNSASFVIRVWLDPAPRWPAARYEGTFRARTGQSVPFYFASGDYRQAEGRAPLASDSCRLTKVREALAAAARLCARQDTRLVVLFIPTKLRVYRAFCTFQAESPCLRWRLGDTPEVLRRMVAGLPGDVTFVDLTAPFQAEAAAGSIVYLPDDTHWAPEGHQAAAIALARTLRSGAVASRGR